eukprot:2981787-Pleurochrysis_carterae.AAC.1
MAPRSEGVPARQLPCWWGSGVRDGGYLYDSPQHCLVRGAHAPRGMLRLLPARNLNSTRSRPVCRPGGWWVGVETLARAAVAIAILRDERVARAASRRAQRTVP